MRQLHNLCMGILRIYNLIFQILFSKFVLTLLMFLIVCEKFDVSRSKFIFITRVLPACLMQSEILTIF